jgi:methyl coenzyme M reductase beta subunit
MRTLEDRQIAFDNHVLQGYKRCYCALEVARWAAYNPSKLVIRINEAMKVLRAPARGILMAFFVPFPAMPLGFNYKDAAEGKRS